jgi:hypothetical protein
MYQVIGCMEKGTPPHSAINNSQPNPIMKAQKNTN